jgi:hypothetical protein
VSDESGNDVENQYKNLESQAVEAFNRWHAFHENLLKLGDFSSWVSEDDNRVDLVTFFALDKENLENYRSALDNQSEFLSAMNELVGQIRTMLDEYESRQD